MTLPLRIHLNIWHTSHSALVACKPFWEHNVAKKLQNAASTVVLEGDLFFPHSTRHFGIPDPSKPAAEGGPAIVFDPRTDTLLLSEAPIVQLLNDDDRFISLKNQLMVTHLALYYYRAFHKNFDAEQSIKLITSLRTVKKLYLIFNHDAEITDTITQKVAAHFEAARAQSEQKVPATWQMPKIVFLTAKTFAELHGTDPPLSSGTLAWFPHGCTPS